MSNWNPSYSRFVVPYCRDISTALLSCRSLNSVYLEIPLSSPIIAPFLDNVPNLQCRMRIDMPGPPSSNEEQAITAWISRHHTRIKALELSLKTFPWWRPDRYTFRQALSPYLKTNAPLPITRLTLRHIPLIVDDQTRQLLGRLESLDISILSYSWSLSDGVTSLDPLQDSQVKLTVLFLEMDPEEAIELPGTMRYLTSYAGLTTLILGGTAHHALFDNLLPAVIEAHSGTLQHLHISLHAILEYEDQPWYAGVRVNLALIKSCRSLMTLKLCMRNHAASHIVDGASEDCDQGSVITEPVRLDEVTIVSVCPLFQAAYKYTRLFLMNDHFLISQGQLLSLCSTLPELSALYLCPHPDRDRLCPPSLEDFLHAEQRVDLYRRQECWSRVDFVVHVGVLGRRVRPVTRTRPP